MVETARNINKIQRPTPEYLIGNGYLAALRVTRLRNLRHARSLRRWRAPRRSERQRDSAQAVARSEAPQGLGGHLTPSRSPNPSPQSEPTWPHPRSSPWPPARNARAGGIAGRSAGSASAKNSRAAVSAYDSRRKALLAPSLSA